MKTLLKSLSQHILNVDIVVENVGDPDYKSKLKVMLGADDAPDIFLFMERVNLHISLQEREVRWI